MDLEETFSHVQSGIGKKIKIPNNSFGLLKIFLILLNLLESRSVEN